MKKLVSLICASTLLTSFTAFESAHAISVIGNRAGAGSFTLGAAYEWFSVTRELKNKGFPYAGAGYDFTDNWGLEGILGFYNTNYKNWVNNTNNVHGTFFILDAVYHFTFYPYIQPLVLFGLGENGINPPYGNDSNNEANVNAGLGVEFFVDRSIALRVDARDFYSFRGGRNDIMADFGITFLWDNC